MTYLFNVSYEIVTQESAEDGEAQEQGFVAEDVSLREACQLIGGFAHEADEWPVRSPRWFTCYDYNQDYVTGGTESRSLHIPAGVTAASRCRIARLLGVKV